MISFIAKKNIFSQPVFCNYLSPAICNLARHSPNPKPNPNSPNQTYYIPIMLSIHLKDLRFFAHHGLHPEEKILGNHFIVNLHLQAHPPAEIVTDIKETINYETLFRLVKARMHIPTPLLETIAMELCYAVMETHESVGSVFVSIEKLNPPIPEMQGGVVVSFQLAREE